MNLEKIIRKEEMNNNNDFMIPIKIIRINDMNYL